MSGDQHRKPESSLLVMQTFMFAIMSSVGIFFFLAWEQTQNGDGVLTENPQTLMFTLVAVAIMGFLAATETNDFQVFLPFGITSVVLMFIHRLYILKKIRYESKNVS